MSDWNRERARPVSVPSTYSAASLSRNSGFAYRVILSIPKLLDHSTSRRDERSTFFEHFYVPSPISSDPLTCFRSWALPHPYARSSRNNSPSTFCLPSCAGKTTFQAFETSSHPRLDRSERFLHVARQLRMRQAVEVRKHDALTLLRLQLCQAMRQRAGFARLHQLLQRPRRVVLPGLYRDLVFLAGGFGVRPAQPVETAIADYAGHPRERSASRRCIVSRVVPYADVAF